jgi:pimeloyl-ACP methyl ester carboxylesterase
MESNFVNIEGVKLFYQEENLSEKNIIFFFHGNSSSHRTWEKQISSIFLSNYRLIAFDLPAHGLSEPASVATANYSLPGIAKVMAEAVIQLTGNKKYLLVGVSIGTNIIAEMIGIGLRPRGILLAGPCIISKEYPVDKIIIPDTKINIFFEDEPSNEDLIDSNKLAVNYPSNEQMEVFLSDFKLVKDNFRSRIAQSIAKGKYNDQIGLIKKGEMSVLIIFGKDDHAFYSSYLDDASMPLWRNTIVKINGAGHWVHLDEPELFTKFLAEYAADLFI